MIFSLKRGHIVRLSLPPPPHFHNAQVRRADTGAPLSDLSSTFLIEVHLASFMCVTMRGLGVQSSHRGSQTKEGRQTRLYSSHAGLNPGVPEGKYFPEIQAPESADLSWLELDCSLFPLLTSSPPALSL